MSQGVLPHPPFLSPTKDFYLSLNCWPAPPHTLVTLCGPLAMISRARYSFETQNVTQGGAACASPAGNEETRAPPQTH